MCSSAGDVRRRQLDRERRLVRVGARGEVAARLPDRRPPRFDGSRFKALREFGAGCLGGRHDGGAACGEDRARHSRGTGRVDPSRDLGWHERRRISAATARATASRTADSIAGRSSVTVASSMRTSVGCRRSRNCRSISAASRGCSSRTRASRARSSTFAQSISGSAAGGGGRPGPRRSRRPGPSAPQRWVRQRRGGRGGRGAGAEAGSA